MAEFDDVRFPRFAGRLQADYRRLVTGSYRVPANPLHWSDMHETSTQNMRRPYPRHARWIGSIPSLCVKAYPLYAWKSANYPKSMWRLCSALEAAINPALMVRDLYLRLCVRYT